VGTVDNTVQTLWLGISDGDKAQTFRRILRKAEPLRICRSEIR